LLQLKEQCEKALDTQNSNVDVFEKLKIQDDYSFKLLVCRAAIKDQIDFNKKLFSLKKIDFTT